MKAAMFLSTAAAALATGAALARGAVSKGVQLAVAGQAQWQKDMAAALLADAMRVKPPTAERAALLAAINTKEKKRHAPRR